MSSFAAMWAPILFGFALFLGSGLLHVIQPLVGKTLLPHLYSNPIVWSTCLVFFQATTLAGYVAADLAHRYRGVRWQPCAAIGLLLLCAFFTFAGAFGDAPLRDFAERLNYVGKAGRPIDGADLFSDWPIVSTLALLVATLGLPCLALAAVTPLLQRWFAHLDHPRASDPYFLFVASNLGALASVVLHTFIVDPNAQLGAQWASWKVAAPALAVAVFLVALCVWRSPRNPEIEPPTPTDPNAPLIPKLIGRGPATWPRRLYWFAASALPIGMLLGLTDLLTLELAPAPVLWSLPIALYLLAFAQSFARLAPVEDALGGRRIFFLIAFAFVLSANLGILLYVLMTWRDGVVSSGGLEFLFGAMLVLMFFMPSRVLGIVQPLWVLLTIFVQTNLYRQTGLSSGSIILQLSCFYLSARLCLDMLARERPAATALTTYFSWIGIGGLGGAMFQLVLAPLIFRTAYFEYFFLAALASTLRPAWLRLGLSDWLLTLPFLPKHDPNTPAPLTWRRWVTLTFDLALPFVVGGAALGLFLMRPQALAPQHGAGGPPWFVRTLQALLADFPLVFALALVLVLVVRPLRFGLALAVVVLLGMLGQNSQNKDAPIIGQRTPFGLFRVGEEVRTVPDINDVERNALKPPERITLRALTSATTHLGSCVTAPIEWRRHPTGHHHRRGPVGRILRGLDAEPNLKPWFDPQRDNALFDGRIVASIIGMGASPDPRLAQLATTWSEPPYAFVSLGAGTLFAYAHPYQWVDAYEFDPAIINLSTRTPPTFHSYQSALERGVRAKIIPGDPRRSLSKPGREGFYHVLLIDASTSGTLPPHLLTQQALETYFQKLSREGIVCVNVTNQHFELQNVLDRVSRQLDLVMRVRTEAMPIPWPYRNSEWVILARSAEVIHSWEKKCGAFDLPRGPNFRRIDRGDRLMWTDERTNLFAAVRGEAHWATMIQWLLGLTLFVGMLLALAEGIYAMQGRGVSPAGKPLKG